MFHIPSLARLAAISASVALCSSLLFAQNPQLQTKNGRRFPTVVFTSVLWNANPSSYSIAVDSIGSATYQSTPNSVDSTGVPYTLVFQSNDSTRRTIFNVAKNLDFFAGELPLTLSSPQTNPVRTLTYHDLTFNNLITYSSSTNSEVEELTSIFEEISTTLEFGRTLTYFHQHDKGALASELKVMQKEAERHHLRELQAVAPTLRSIAADASVDESTREQARAVLNTTH
ncbi:MAG TPA: hypothetical protein VJO35_09520 [Terriglobales bacterium]|nr:hypothetical protein [Terriglobales bacterium]